MAEENTITFPIPAHAQYVPEEVVAYLRDVQQRTHAGPIGLSVEIGHLQRISEYSSLVLYFSHDGDKDRFWQTVLDDTQHIRASHGIDPRNLELGVGTIDEGGGEFLHLDKEPRMLGMNLQTVYSVCQSTFPVWSQLRRVFGDEALKNIAIMKLEDNDEEPADPRFENRVAIRSALLEKEKVVDTHGKAVCGAIEKAFNDAGEHSWYAEYPYMNIVRVPVLREILTAMEKHLALRQKEGGQVKSSTR